MNQKDTRTQNLDKISEVVSVLITYFTLSGASNIDDSFRYVQVNHTLSLLALKDELLQEYGVPQAVSEFQQHPLDFRAKAELERCLIEVLNRHRIFNKKESASVSVRGNISADRGGVTGALIEGDVSLNNTFAPEPEKDKQSSESSQKYIGRNRGPRVHIDYETRSIPDDDFFSDSDVRSVADDPFDFSDIGVNRSLPNDIADPKPAKPQKSLPVEFLALAAQGNVSGSACIVDIWACAPDQTEDVRRKAALTGLDAVMGMKAGLSVAAASLLTVSLDIQGMEIADNIAVIHWQGEAANASFILKFSVEPTEPAKPT